MNATGITCNMWPSTLNVGHQPFAQNLPANTQPFITPILAAPGFVWPASGNLWAQPNLPVIAPARAVNPAPIVLSPNPPSDFTAEPVPVRNAEENSLNANRIDFSSFTSSDWCLESFLTKNPAPSSSTMMENQSATEIASPVSHQVNIVLSIHV